MEDLNLIVMLTYNDQTVENAFSVFDQCKENNVIYWGFKEKNLPISEMKRVYKHMKNHGKKTVLEVVAYTEEECLEGAKMALECECDILMGTMFSDKINKFCLENNIKYMPFVGEVVERPSILKGDVEDMIKEAYEYVEKGAYGVDLLGYRYDGDASKLVKDFIDKTDFPVCVAGSINSYDRLDELKDISPWAFTIGSAFFDNKFGDDFNQSVIDVKNYIKGNNV